MPPRSATLFALFVTTVLPTAATAQKAVIVARHAENASDALTEAGRARAEHLAAVLERAGVGAIYSTDSKRTIGTATPLAEARKLPVRIYDTGGGSTPVDASSFVHELRKNHPDDVVLVIGHTTTIPDLLKILGCPGEVSIAPTEYGDLFIVVPRRGETPTLVRLKY